MTFDERLRAISAGMTGRKLDVLVAIHDGAHFIETPNPVMVLTGFKSIGPAAAVLTRDGAVSLIVTPAWDGDRAGAACPGARIVAADDAIDGLASALAGQRATKAAVGLAGLSFAPWGMARLVIELLPGAVTADAAVYGPGAVKTDAEIARAKRRASPSSDTGAFSKLPSPASARTSLRSS